MMRSCVVFLAAVAACHASRDTAIAQVISDIEAMCTQNKEDGSAEIADWGKYNREQQGLINDQKKIIKEQTEKFEAEKLEQTRQAAIEAEKLEAEKEAKANLDGLAKEAAGLADQKAANLKENTAKQADLEATISAIDTAIGKIEGAKPALEQETAVNDALTLADSLGDRREVKSFLQQRGNAPPTRTTKGDWKSGGVLSLLGDLKNDFTSKLNAAKTAAANIAANSEVAESANTESTTSQEEIRDAAIAAKEAAAEAKENAKTAKEAAAKSKQDAQDEKESIEANLKEQSRLFGESQDERQKVKEGCNEILKILRADADIAVKEMFLQVSDPIHETAMVLKAQSLRYHDIDIGHVADMMLMRQAPGDNTYKGSQSEESKCVFEETVIPMIDKMLKKVNDEKREASNDWGYCKKQLSNLGVDMAKMANDISKLDDRVSTLQTTETKANEDAEAAQKKVTQNEEDKVDLEAIRRENKNENNKCIADATKAVDALERAKTACAQYFGGSNKAAEGDASWAKEHKRSGSDGATMVADLLQTTQDKYSTMKTTCTEKEASELKTFNEEIQTNAIDTASEKAKHENQSKKAAMALAEKGKKQDQLDKTKDQLELTESTSKDYGHACGDRAALNAYLTGEGSAELAEDKWFKNGDASGKVAVGETMQARIDALKGMFDRRQTAFDDERAAMLKGKEALRKGCETMMEKRDAARAAGSKALADGSKSLKDEQKELADAQR